MVLGIIIATATAPGLLGSQEAIRQSQAKEKREEHRARRCNLIATCVKSSTRSRELNGRPVVLRNSRLWINTGTDDGSPLGHPYAGYYLPYPDSDYEGLVTTITDDAPIMNWVYVDKETHQVKYGVRVDAQPNLTGPFDCTRQDRRLTFDGWEGWCAVEEIPGLWALYFDVNDDGLITKVSPDKIVLELELSRKEKRFKREANVRQQDQTTKRSVNIEDDAPIDQPLAPDALAQRPGVTNTPPDPAQADTTPKPAPFPIPKSIFENPPPIVEGSLTPPDTSLLDRSPSPLIVPPRHSPSPLNSKRTIPKFNRNCGTRALAQAQKFEAMVAAKEPKIELQRKSSQCLSRTSSNADYASQYSGEDVEDSGTIQPERKVIPSTSAAPAPLSLDVTETTTVSPPTDTTEKPHADPEPEKPHVGPEPEKPHVGPEPEKPHASSEPAKRPANPRRTSSPAVGPEPAAFGAGSLEKPRRPTLTRRPTTTKESPALRTSASRNILKASDQSLRPLQRPSTAPLRPPGAETPSFRSRSSSIRERALASPRPTSTETPSLRPRSSSIRERALASPRPTSGRGKHPPSVPATVREGGTATEKKTTSALSKEVDERHSKPHK